MILFIFEGKDDKTYFESIKRLFFPKKSETFVCTYNSNIYSLYTKLKSHDALHGMLEVNTVSVFKEILLEKDDETLKTIREDEVSEIYLFFDYDFQERQGHLKRTTKDCQNYWNISRTKQEEESCISTIQWWNRCDIQKNFQIITTGNIQLLARDAKMKSSSIKYMSSLSMVPT